MCYVFDHEEGFSCLEMFRFDCLLFFFLKLLIMACCCTENTIEYSLCQGVESLKRK